MRISLNESLRLRGVAILLMIWLHCFNKDLAGEHYISVIPFLLGGVSFEYLLTRIAQICVPLYCFLSGYGLCCKFPYGKEYTIKKGMTLVMQDWFVLTVFILLGLLTSLSSYNYSISSILGNYLGYKTSWNTTLWFLMPYLILLLSSIYILNSVNKYKIVYVVLFVLIVYALSTILAHFGIKGVISLSPLAKILVNTGRLLLPFVMGIYCKKFENLEFAGWLQGRLAIAVAFLFLISRSVLQNFFLLPFHCLAAIYFLHTLKFSKSLDKMLVFLGKQSTMMWFCHAYFIYYYLKDFVFVGNFSPLIFCLAVFYSLISALILDYVFNKLRTKII